MIVKFTEPVKQIRCHEKELPFGLYYGKARGFIQKDDKHVLFKTSDSLWFLLNGMFSGGGTSGSELVDVVKIAVTDISVLASR